MRKKSKALLIGFMAFSCLNSISTYASQSNIDISSYRVASGSDCDEDLNAIWDYEENDTGVTITKYKSSNLNVVIPEKIGEKNVTAIGEDVFSEKGIESVYIPETVTDIQNHAFSYCESLSEIHLPHGIEKIGSNAFRGCSGVDSIDLPETIKEIGSYAFAGCKNISEIIVPEGVEKLDLSIIYETSVKTLHIPSTINDIVSWNGYPLSVSEFTISENNNHFVVENDMILSKDKTEFYAYPTSKILDEEIREIKIPKTVTNIKSVRCFPDFEDINYELYHSNHKYNVFVGNNVVEIDGLDANRFTVSFEHFWTPKGSYVEQAVKIKNEMINAASESDFDKAMEIPFTIRDTKKYGWSVIDAYGTDKTLNIPGKIGEIEIKHIEPKVFSNDYYEILVFPETINSIYYETSNSGTWPGYVVRRTTIHQIVNNSSIPIDITYKSSRGNYIGWSDKNSPGGTFYDNIIPPKTTVYKRYSLSYERIPEDIAETYVQEFGYKEEINLPAGPYKSGYKFLGWTYSGGNHDGEYVNTPEFITKVSDRDSNTKVYAVYQKQTSSSSSGGSGSGGGGSSKPNKKPANPEVVVIVIKDTHEGSAWEQKDGIWYLKKSDGTYATDWAAKDGEWYYMNPDGTMQTGWKLINNLWYHFSASGSMEKGWSRVGGFWYYLNPENGDMLTGWQLVDNKWYYMEPTNGNMLTGWQQIDGKHYYMTPSGDMLSNTTTPDGYKVDENGAWIQ